jgi:hypothetical protein
MLLRTKWWPESTNAIWQARMLKFSEARTIEVKASRLALISQPDTIANVVLEAAGHS